MERWIWVTALIEADCSCAFTYAFSNPALRHSGVLEDDGTLCLL
jgi:hypothetical protein